MKCHWRDSNPHEPDVGDRRSIQIELQRQGADAPVTARLRSWSLVRRRSSGCLPLNHHPALYPRRESNLPAWLRRPCARSTGGGECERGPGTAPHRDYHHSGCDHHDWRNYPRSTCPSRESNPVLLARHASALPMSYKDLATAPDSHRSAHRQWEEVTPLRVARSLSLPLPVPTPGIEPGILAL